MESVIAHHRDRHATGQLAPRRHSRARRARSAHRRRGGGRRHRRRGPDRRRHRRQSRSVASDCRNSFGQALDLSRATIAVDIAPVRLDPDRLDLGAQSFKNRRGGTVGRAVGAVEDHPERPESRAERRPAGRAGNPRGRRLAPAPCPARHWGARRPISASIWASARRSAWSPGRRRT